MRNIINKLGLIALLGAGVFAYYMYQNKLNPTDINDIKKAADSARTKIDKISDVVTDTADINRESVVYKRKDAKGNWYYSNEPPEEGEEAEKIIYRSDTNVLPPLPGDKKTKK